MKQTLKTLLVTTLLAAPTTFGANAANYDPSMRAAEPTQSTKTKVTAKKATTQTIPLELILTITGQFATQLDAQAGDKKVKCWIKGYLSNKADLLSLALTNKKFYSAIKPAFHVFNRIRHMGVPALMPAFRSISPEVEGLLTVLNASEGEKFDQLISLLIEGKIIITSSREAIKAIRETTNFDVVQLKKMKTIVSGLSLNASRKEMIDAADIITSPSFPKYNEYVSYAAMLYEKSASFKQTSADQIIEAAKKLSHLATLLPIGSPKKELYATKAISLYNKAAKFASSRKDDLCSIAEGYLTLAEQYIPNSQESIKLATKGLKIFEDAQQKHQINTAHVTKIARSALGLANQLLSCKNSGHFISLLINIFVDLIEQDPSPKNMKDLAELYVKLAHQTHTARTRYEYATKATEVFKKLLEADVLHQIALPTPPRILLRPENEQENIFIQTANILLSLMQLLPAGNPKHSEITNVAINFCEIYEEQLRTAINSILMANPGLYNTAFDLHLQYVCYVAAVLSSIAKQFPLGNEQKDYYSSKAASLYQLVGYHGNEARKNQVSNGFSELAALYPVSHPKNNEYDYFSKISITFYFDDQQLSQYPTAKNIKFYADKYVKFVHQAELNTTKYQYASKVAELFNMLPGTDHASESANSILSLLQLLQTNSPENIGLAKSAAFLCDIYEETLLRKANSFFWSGSIIDINAFDSYLADMSYQAARYGKIPEQLPLEDLDKDLYSSKASTLYKYLGYYGSDVWKTCASNGFLKLASQYPDSHPKHMEYYELSQTSFTPELYIEMLGNEPSTANLKIISDLYVNLAHQTRLEGTSNEYVAKAIESFKRLQETSNFKYAADSILSLMNLFPLGSPENIELANLAALSCEIYDDSLISKFSSFFMNGFIIDIEALDYYLQDVSSLAARYRMIAQQFPLDSDEKDIYSEKAANLYKLIGEYGNELRKQDVFVGFHELSSLYPQSHQKHKEYLKLMNAY